MNPPIPALLERAKALQDTGDWSRAGEAWREAAALVMSREPERAGEVWALAGEAFRRADRLADAEEAFRNALAHHPSPDRAVFLAVSLAACLSERGRGEAAIALLERFPGEGELAVVVADSRVSLDLAWGTVDEARSRLGVLSANVWAHTLRRGQLSRLSGAFDAAADDFSKVSAWMQDHPAGLGAVRLEQAVLASYRGSSADWDSAEAAHERSGRFSSWLRCRSARARMSPPGSVDVAPLEDARERVRSGGLVLLGLDLDLAIGWARQDVDLLAHVFRETGRLGLFRRSGRAAVSVARCLEPEAALPWLKDALALLREDVPEHLRARAARARCLLALDRAEGASAAAAVVRELRATGMVADGAALEALLEG